jgi:phenylpropionate dioxygenase-like ring-hydroxylating dioxygenase large terminal subunit
LQFVPDEENFYNLEKEKLNLTPVVTDLWEGFIFVHLDPNPRENLREYLGEIVDGLDGYAFHKTTRCYEYRVVIDCNWKVLLSAFLETYHARALHLRIANQLSWHENPFCHTDFIKLFDKHRMFAFVFNPKARATKLGSIVYARQGKLMANTEAIASKSPSKGLSDDTFRALNSSFIIRNIFPNFQLNLVRGNWFFHQFWPISVDKSLWVVRMYFPKPRSASEAFFQAYGCCTSRDNLSEDGLLTERQQMGIKSGRGSRPLLRISNDLLVSGRSPPNPNERQNAVAATWLAFASSMM